MQLGSIGVWSGSLRRGEPAEVYAAAAELEELGYSALWMPGGPPTDLPDHLDNLLKSTRRAVIATGIISAWTHPASSTAAMHARLTSAYQGRCLPGPGISHQPAAAGA